MVQATNVCVERGQLDRTPVFCNCLYEVFSYTYVCRCTNWLCIIFSGCTSNHGLLTLVYSMHFYHLVYGELICCYWNEGDTLILPLAHG